MARRRYFRAYPTRTLSSIRRRPGSRNVRRPQSAMGPHVQAFARASAGVSIPVRFGQPRFVVGRRFVPGRSDLALRAPRRPRRGHELRSSTTSLTRTITSNTGFSTRRAIASSIRSCRRPTSSSTRTPTSSRNFSTPETRGVWATKLEVTGATARELHRSGDGASYNVNDIDPHVAAAYRFDNNYAFRATFDHTTVAPKKPLEADRTDSTNVGPDGQPAPFVPLAPETANNFTYSLEGGGKNAVSANVL